MPSSPEGDTPSSWTYQEPRLPVQIGRYRILGRLGAGGMGTVYKALDSQLERMVALKVPNFEAADEDSAVLAQRFLREARAAALIHHPHVCPIFDVGEAAGRPYAVMAYVEGQSLAERLRGGRCYDPTSAVRLVREVADALEAVHARGLLHRDLKPGNILVDQEGHAVLTDFGLARPRLDSERLTADGALLGTPAFMAPEQAAGKSDCIGPWTDVYGLGVVLYRLLTGRLPFEGDAVTILWKIGNETPPLPSQLRQGIGRDLEAIVLHAMARRVEDRFISAQDMRAALDHWLVDAPAPALARPDAATRDAEGSGATTVAVTTPATRPDWAPALPATRTSGQPVGSFLETRPFPRKTRPWIVITGLGLLLVAGPLAALVLNLSPGSRGPADEGAEQREQTGVVITPEALSWSAGVPLSQRALVSRPAPIPGVFSWTVETREPRGPVRTLAYSPAGDVLACAGDDGMVRLWRTGSQELLRILVGHDGKVLSLAWSPDGRYLASASDDSTIRLWQADSGQTLRILRGHSEAVEGLSWSPDGMTLASASRDRSVRLWRVTDGQPLPVTLSHPHAVLHVAWSPDSKKLASAGRDRTIRLWDAASGGLLHALQKDGFPHVFGLAWSPDGKVLASAGQDCQLRLWDPATGQLRHAIDSSLPVIALAWSPLGDRLATVTFATVQTWDRAGRLITTREKGECVVHNLAWAPDGSIFSTAGDEGVHSYDKATGKPAGLIAVHPVGAAAVTWSPAGELAVSGLGDERLRLWLAREGKLFLPEGKLHPVAAWSPDGKQLAVVGTKNTVRVWEAKLGAWGASLPGHTAAVKALCWSPNSKLLASASEDGSVRLWDMPSGKPRQTLQSQESAVSSLAWSGDGSRLAVTGFSGALQLWQVGGEKPVLVLEDHEGRVRAVAWSPDGQVVATAGSEAEGFVLLRKAPPGRRLRHAATERAGAHSLAWSPDSKGLVAGGAGGFLHIWSKDGALVWSTVKAHAGPITALSWSPAGDVLASAGREDLVRLWKMKPVDENQDKAWYPAPVLLALREGGTLVVSPQGHWTSLPGAAGQLVYVLQTDTEQQLLSAPELARDFSWSNNSARAILSDR